MKGISPLIAAVLLIAITVAIATLIMGWMSTVARTAQVKVENKTFQAIDCSSASISIEDVYVKAGNISTGEASVVVSNSGQVDDLTIQAVILLNTTGGNFSSGSVPVTDFDQGDVENFAFNISVSACPGGFSKVMVTTDCGGVSDTFDTAPKCYS